MQLKKLALALVLVPAAVFAQHADHGAQDDHATKSDHAAQADHGAAASHEVKDSHGASNDHGTPAEPAPKVAPALATTGKPRVSLRAKGDDVRTVLGNLFEQSKKQYVLPGNVHYALYLSVENMDFEKALNLVCEQAGLSAELEDGIYRVRPAAKKPSITAPIKSEVKLVAKSEPKAEATKHEAVKEARAESGHEVKAETSHDASHDAESNGEMVRVVVSDPASATKKALARKITTRSTKVDLRKILSDLSEQAEVSIDIDDTVPGYRVDAFLIKTSLKYALDRITKAANLAYKTTETGSILVYKPVL